MLSRDTRWRQFRVILFVCGTNREINSCYENILLTINDSFSNSFEDGKLRNNWIAHKPLQNICAFRDKQLFYKLDSKFIF